MPVECAKLLTEWDDLRLGFGEDVRMRWLHVIITVLEYSAITFPICLD